LLEKIPEILSIMKKLFTFVVVAASLAYYASLPFVVAQAGGNPASTSTTTQSATVSGASAVLYLRVTAYASVPDETSDHPFIMADGHHVYDGAAASNILPFGTKIEIPALFGNKVFTIEDRTSPRFSQTVDLWMPSVAAAVYFGMTHTSVVVLDEPTSTRS
jgi:3D (Asp-Asp-Asp) domain-containing protein